MIFAEHRFIAPGDRHERVEWEQFDDADLLVAMGRLGSSTCDTLQVQVGDHLDDGSDRIIVAGTDATGYTLATAYDNDDGATLVDAGADDGASDVVIRIGGILSPLPRRIVVPRAHALAAIEFFIESGGYMADDLIWD